MTGREGTLQSLDPLGALAGRPLTVLGAISGAVVAVALTVANGSEIANPALAFLAVLLAVVACATLYAVTRPENAPVGRGPACLIVTSAFAANVLDAAGTWGRNTLARDDWGPILLGVLLLALCPYRPTAEIRALALASAGGVAAITLLESRYFVIEVPALVFVAIAVAPILALGFAGASFADTVLARLDQWRRRAEKASQAHVEDQEEGIVRSVQQSRVSILNQEVVPLFAGLLERREVTPQQVERASEVAAAVRAVMLVETQRTWLDELVAPARTGTETTVWRSPVRDAGRLADAMSFDQRAAMRALLSALAAQSIARDLWIDLSRDRASNTVILRGTTDLPEPGTHAALSPYLAVLRAVFDDVIVDVAGPELTLRFSYAPH